MHPSTGRHALLGLLITILVPVSGCGAIRAGVQIQDAVDARDVAAERGAPDAAPYEHTLAERYLQKAWEEMGTGQYKTAVQLAKKSAEWSDQAVIQIQRGHRPLELDDATLEDAPAPSLGPGPTPESNDPGPPRPPPDPVPMPEGPPPGSQEFIELYGPEPTAEDLATPTKVEIDPTPSAAPADEPVPAADPTTEPNAEAAPTEPAPEFP